MMEYILSADKEYDAKVLEERLSSLQDQEAIRSLHRFVTGDYSFVADDETVLEYVRALEGVIAIEPAGSYFISGDEGYACLR